MVDTMMRNHGNYNDIARLDGLNYTISELREGKI